MPRVLYNRKILQPFTKTEMHEVTDGRKFALFDALDTTLVLHGKTYSLLSDYVGTKAVKDGVSFKGMKQPLLVHFSVQEVIPSWKFWKSRALLFQQSWHLNNARLQELSEALWQCHVDGINGFTKSLATS